MDQLNLQLQSLASGQHPPIEFLASKLQAMPLFITADGVTVPFRPHPKTPKGKIKWQEVKIALFTRPLQHQTKKGKIVTRLHQRRLVAVLGSIDDLINPAIIESTFFKLEPLKTLDLLLQLTLPG